ncbi:UNVERIFIED_CONTAM: hypothetical protein Sradi_7064800 [Sesamum radiatum]|uniref:Reverse transcriptase domain-containing protein n=1 Tax=Sesamum radiatum TaxID=300843 RepID=A0AAW2J5X2_SESRA
MISMAAWNVRGLNNIGHQEAVGELVRDYKLQCLGLIETRVGASNVQRVRSHLLPNWSWFDDYNGPGGRIWLAWNNQKVDIVILKVENQFIHCKATNKRMHTTCLISVIYGACDMVLRRELWAGLQRLEEEVQDVPWLLLGDFNAVIDSSEVCGNAAGNRASMTEFREFITGAGLVHLPFTGCPFTWHNCSEGNRSLWKRLDQVMVNEAWLECWPQSSYLSALPKTSDHSPLVLLGTERSTEHTPFRFDNFLAHQAGFLDSVASIWRYKGEVLLLLVKCCRMIYCTAVTMEKRMLQQRAKLRWLNDGDQSSKVFFRKINTRRARQRVYQINTPAGECLTEMSQVTTEFISFFQNLLGGTRRGRELNLLELRPGAKYVLSIEDGARLIAPITDEEIKEAFFDISEDSAPGPDGLPSQVSDYRPIACCNVIYKAITKVIVKRMQQVLHLIIDQSQNAFVPGRSISDNIMLAQELLAGYNQAKLPPRCTIKVDIQKAYDSVEWDFLLQSLKMFNFPAQFIGWIEQCISTVMFSISLNGSLVGFFPSSRGLRQGDPMSPYLFVIVMEVWCILLQKREQQAEEFQFHWKCKAQGILNLCFADDVLIFCKGNVQSVRIIKDILEEFAAVSGLRVNPMKSQVILSRAAQTVIHEIINVMGFQEGTLPLKYLGVPLVSSKLSVTDCRPLLQKIDDRLAGWRHLTLSFAGRVQLIKSVLSAMHAYWASVFLLPKKVIKEIEGRMRRFLWYGSSDSGCAKVASEQTIWTLNVATAPWCWKQIIKICHILKPGLEYRVGNGAKFKLWQDLWHDRGPLLTHYPRGPLITGLPADAMLMEVLQHGCWTWPSQTDIEIAEIIATLPTIHPGESDVIRWKLEPGRFNSAAVFALLDPPTTTVMWSVLLGGKFKIPRHIFILWLAIKGRLSTMDRPWMNHRDDGCVLCNFEARESHCHLFFSCSYTRHCLATLKEKVRFSWPMQDWHQGITWASRKWRGKHLWHAASKALLASIVYHVWTERNCRKFQSTASSAETVALRAIEVVRLRIIRAQIPPSAQAFTLYRNWQIPWHREIF